jgi:predicted 3-demethylubiquinone-9 3-methyltransferase (glyoxalase superfamily)
MTQEIGVCLWFNSQAKEAAQFYETVFDDFSMISENPLAVNYKMMGQRFMNLNGGPIHTINPSVSFFIEFDAEDSLEKTWNKLIEGGTVMMPLNEYPWSKKYGWCADKFGVNWQLMIHKGATSDKLIPNLMFVNANNGLAQEAINYYTGIFPESKKIAISKYEKGEPDTEGNIKYSRFLLNGKTFGAMESSYQHKFDFTEGISFMVIVDTQEEIDFYWDKLVEGGKPGRCGWLTDKYGISWQIIPSILGKLMNDPATAPKASFAFLQMSKFVIADLIKGTKS